MSDKIVTRPAPNIVNGSMHPVAVWRDVVREAHEGEMLLAGMGLFLMVMLLPWYVLALPVLGIGALIRCCTAPPQKPEAPK